MSQPITVFLLDNVDSFTYNLVDELRTMELNIVVYRNNVDARMLFEKMQMQAEIEQELAAIQRSRDCAVVASVAAAQMAVSQRQQQRADKPQGAWWDELSDDEEEMAEIREFVAKRRRGDKEKQEVICGLQFTRGI